MNTSRALVLLCLLGFLEACSQQPGYTTSGSNTGSTATPFGDTVAVALDASGNLLIGGVTGDSNSQLPCSWKNGTFVGDLVRGHGQLCFFNRTWRSRCVGRLFLVRRDRADL